MIKEVANLLFELFVINRKAIAVQTKDGKYMTKYMRVSSNDVYRMLKNRNAVGCYQQLYKSPYLKWICFDFDCIDKENPDMDGLYRSCTLPLNIYLEKMGITYVNEFSGRRGIHTWVFLNEFVEKKYAYSILEKILENANIQYDRSKYGLDKFPSTPNSKGNTLGKQVKIPLSVHTKGIQSFMFEGNFKYECYDDGFWERQLNILQNIRKNDVDEVLEKLQIESKISAKYVRTYIKDSVEIDAQQIIDILSEIQVYKEIFERLQNGESHPRDWFVLLGTLGKIRNGDLLLSSIYKYSPCYSEEETQKRIREYSDIYFPATFRYLYTLYDLEMEEHINPNENGLIYLASRLELDVDEYNGNANEKNLLDDSKFTIEKELNYLMINDEVPVISIYSDLKHMTLYDSVMVNKYISQIEDGDTIDIEPTNYHVFERVENENKTRKMVSLCAFERVLTTHLALRLFYTLSGEIKSYSYNPNYLSRKDIFYHWYSSWGNYLGMIRKYLEIDLYEELNVISLDISKFYDSIDFLGVYSLIEEKMTPEAKNAMHFLITYNENLMINISKVRRGVPQGPAYARLIAEVFLGVIIEIIKLEIALPEEKIQIYRYVDDIIIFHEDSIDAEKIYNIFNRNLLRNGLSLNKEKSKIYGKIKNLSINDRAELLREGQFQYGLKQTDYSYLLEDEYIKIKVDQFISKTGKFDISNVPFFFSKYTDERAKERFFRIYASDIFSSSIGRGSAFSIFYNYIFSNMDILGISFRCNFFNKIPINTINFSCFLSALYFFRMKNTDFGAENDYWINLFLNELDVQKLESEEDKSIVLALISRR